MTSWRHRSMPSGAATLERRTRHCVLQVTPRDWRFMDEEAGWIVRCSKDPLEVDKPLRPDPLSPGYKTTRGRAGSVANAKKSAIAASKRLARWEVSNAAEIEKIAKDIDKRAREIDSAANEARARGAVEERDQLRKRAEEVRAQARAVRAQKFEGRKARR